jgi:ectoine hydroxylase-related dioxygenase (phytanoyl-CoA dioxygenase family)
MQDPAEIKRNALTQLEDPYPLSKENIRFFKENGYIKLKGVFDQEVLEYYGNIITRLVFSLNKLTKPMAERTTYEKAFLQIMNLWCEDADAKDFVFSKRLAKIASDLMEVEGVRLYHDQALYKEPGGGITPWHADQFYWPLSNNNTVTAWIPLQYTPAEMGPLAFAEKSQHAQIGRDLEISDDSEKLLSDQLEKLNLNVNNTYFDLGEISYHAGWTFHRAGPNISDRPRKVMTIIYMDKDVRVLNPKNTYQENDWKTWLGSTPIGTIPQTSLNPVLFDMDQ